MDPMLKASYDMKTGHKILLIVSGFCLSMSLWPNPKAIATPNDDRADTVKKKKMPVYLGKSNLSGGPIAKHVFDSLLKQGIRGQDANGVYKVDGFEFSYAEVKLYEDSIGRLVWLTDYQTEYCNGDTITTDLHSSLFERTKIGDTVYFDNIMLKNDKNIPFPGRSMRFEITSK